MVCLHCSEYKWGWAELCSPKCSSSRRFTTQRLWQQFGLLLLPLLIDISVLCPLGWAGFYISTRKLIWLKNSIPKKIWVYFFTSNQVPLWLVSDSSSGPKTTGWWAAVQRQAWLEGEHSWHEASIAAKRTQQHDSEPRLIQAHLMYRIPPKGDNSPSVQMQGPCGLEQKKVYYFLSLAKYFWAAAVFILLTGVKPYLVANPLPAPVDNWLLSINVACSIFCWEVAQMLQNEDPNLLITPVLFVYITNLAHTLSHVSAASVPSFCFPDEHMRALTCICAQTTCCRVQEGFLH